MPKKTLVQIFLNEEETKIVDEAKKINCIDVRNAFCKMLIMKSAKKSCESQKSLDFQLSNL